MWKAEPRISWACVVAALLPATELAAQQTDAALTLAEARTLLRQSSPEYRAALASADAAGEGVWSAWGSWIPTASLRVNLSRNEFTTRSFLDPTGVAQELEDPITDVAKSASQALIFNWSLFAGGTRFFDTGASRARIPDWA